MVFRGVELGEIIVCLLDFWAVHNLKAHVQEDFLHLVQHGIHRVFVSHRGLFPGYGHIQGFRVQTGFQGLAGEDGGMGFQGLLQAGPHVVGKLAHHGTQLRRKLAHLLQHRRQLAFLAQILHPQSVQPRRVLRRADGLQRAFPYGLQLFFHNIKTLSLNLKSGVRNGKFSLDPQSFRILSSPGPEGPLRRFSVLSEGAGPAAGQRNPSW